MRILIFLSLLLTLISCTDKHTKKQHGQSTIEQPKYAKLFHFEINDKGEQELVVLDADTGSEIFRNIALDHPKTVVLSTTHIGMLDAIDQLELIVGIPSKKFIHNPTLLKNSGGLIEVINDNQLPLEEIYFSKTQLFIHSAYSPQLTQHKLLNDKNIISLPNQDWKETSPLARAEWIIALGFIIGEHDKAIEKFNEIEKNYQLLTESAKDLPSSKQTICGNIFADYWNTPAKDSYAAQLLRDAKIDYIYKDVEGKTTLALTLEQVIAENTQTHLWLNPGANSKKSIKLANSKAEQIPAFVEGNIYCYSHQNNYYWENALVYPDRLLGDLIQIAHPQQNFIQSKLYFYQKVK